jgi:hypothetical protein
MMKYRVDGIPFAVTTLRMRTGKSLVMMMALVLAALVGMGKARAACDETDPGPPPGQFE